MRNLRTGRIVLGMAVIVILGGLYEIGGVKHSIALAAGQAVSPVRSVAVTSVTRACPSPGWAGAAGGGIALMAAPAKAGTGQAVVSRLAAAGSATGGKLLFSATHPGHVQLAGVGTDKGAAAHAQKASGQGVATTPVRGGVVVRATGAMAQGLEVEQTAAGGLPTASCGSPGTDFWFIGPGQHSVPRIAVFLMNPSAQAAGADVDVFTDAGPLQGSTDTGITVPPHGMVVQSLAAMLHGSRSIALHVRTGTGQVVAAVQESVGTGQGAWLPVAQTPATHLVIPGLPGTAGSRQLYVTVPGIHDAKLKLRAVTSRGSYEPTGAGGIDIPGGSAIDISLPSLGGIPAALKVTSNVPVTAVAMATGGVSGAPGAFTAAAAAIQEQGVVADDLSAAGKLSSLVLSAPRAAARVRVVEAAQTTGSASSSVRQSIRVVPVRAGHSVVLPLATVPGSKKGSAFAMVITPLAGSGPVYAGRVIVGSGAGGVLQAILPVPSALTAVPLSPVRNAFLTTVP